MSEAARPRLVFATCRPPYPPDNGSRIRAHRLLTGLVQSFDTLVVTFEFEPGDPDGHYTREQLQTLIPGAAVVTVPEARRAKRMGQLVSLPRRESWSLGRYRTAAYTAALNHAVTSHRPAIVHFDDAGVALVRPFPGTLNVYSAHNIEQTILRLGARAGSPPRRLFNAVEAGKVSREERRIWSSMDICLAVSPLDAAVMKAGGARRVELCPNGAESVEPLGLRPRRNGEPLRLLFVGSGNYAPYERGLAWIVRQVLPRVRSEVAVELDIVGTPPAHLLAADGVRYVGRVPAVQPYYERAHVVVVPVFEGSGTRLKVIEAAAFGRPVVSTSLGAEGLPLEAGVHFMQADGAEEFAAAVLKLERCWREPIDVSLERMVAQARDAVRPLAWTRIVERLSALYRSALAGAPPFEDLGPGSALATAVMVRPQDGTA
ncbi:MAG: glycosyltransferase [Solirubrobacteraceae bacterium]|jgi:glycosyltransferase involved in cell wall biosynthesis